MIYTLSAAMFDLLVLSVINKRDSYGYEISQMIKSVSNTQDSALYPVLRRLQDNRYVLAYDRQFQGRNRKYYAITDEGRNRYQILLTEWGAFTGMVSQIMKGDVANDEERVY